MSNDVVFGISIENKKCLNCGNNIPIGKNKKQLKRTFCKKECRREYYIKKYREENPLRKKILPTGTVGSISLYKVAIDLLKKGYYVFISASNNAPFDMVLFNGKDIKRIEVTTGCRTPKGKIYYPIHDKNKSDHIAVAVNELIYYFPEIDKIIP